MPKPPSTVRAGQVWTPITEHVPDLRVLKIAHREAECQVIGRDRTMRVDVRRLESGAAGYRRKDKDPE